MLPAETVQALFPGERVSVRLGLFRRVVFHPLTLERAAAMEALGCGITDRDAGDVSGALLAAWILALPDKAVASVARSRDISGFRRWSRRLGSGVLKVAAVASGIVSGSTRTFVPPRTSGGSNAVDDGIGHGYGWVLEIAESLMADYSMTMREALGTEASVAFALLAVKRGKHGESGGPDYFDRIRMRKMKAEGII